MELKIRVCASPPQKQDLADMVAHEMNNRELIGEPYDGAISRMALIVSKKQPAVDWLLLVLGTLDPDHKIFAKNYVAPIKDRERQKDHGIFVNNFDGFFSGLPSLKSKGRIRIMILDPA